MSAHTVQLQLEQGHAAHRLLTYSGGGQALSSTTEYTWKRMSPMVSNVPVAALSLSSCTDAACQVKVLAMHGLV